MRELRSIDKDFGSQDVAVIGLSTENPLMSARIIRRFTANSGIRYQLGWVDVKTASILQGERKVIPQVLILRSDGRILKRYEGWDPVNRGVAWRDAIQEILKTMD